MIIKKAAERKESSAGRVIDYIDRALDYLKRANLKEQDRPVTFTGNCLSDDLDLCKLEIESTQKMNKRAKGDKTYHMIISFSPEDNLTTELHKKLVAEVCKGLGFEDHQRVCAIHKDTDNEHCHVVINKIHPKTFKIHNPYYDGFQMNDIARELEQKYKLTVINHSNEKNDKKVNHKLHYDGVKSFDQWVKDEVKVELESKIKAGADWKEVVEHLAKYNLHVRKRGNGLVISDKDKPLFMKASSLSRQLKGLGPFDESVVSPSNPDAVKYDCVPLTGDNPLWQKYSEDKEAGKIARQEIFSRYRELRASVRQEAKRQRINVKFNTSIRGKEKRDQDKNISDAVTSKIAELDAAKKAELGKHSTSNWLDFLMKQYNDNGNMDAMEQLKKSKIFQPKFKNKIAGQNPDAELFSKVDKVGHSYEEVGKARIFLVNDNLETQSDDLAVATRALEIALDKYQTPIVVDGSKEFIKAIQLVAGIKGVEVTVAGQETNQQQRDIEI